MSRYKDSLETTTYRNGQSARTHNKRITTCYLKVEENEDIENLKEDSVSLVFQSCLPEELLIPNVSNIRLSRKETVISITIEQAVLLHESLTYTLKTYAESINK